MNYGNSCTDDLIVHISSCAKYVDIASQSKFIHHHAVNPKGRISKPLLS